MVVNDTMYLRKKKKGDHSLYFNLATTMLISDKQIWEYRGPWEILEIFFGRGGNVFVLSFNGPANTIKVISSRSLNLFTLPEQAS